MVSNYLKRRRALLASLAAGGITRDGAIAFAPHLRRVNRAYQQHGTWGYRRSASLRGRTRRARYKRSYTPTLRTRLSHRSRLSSRSRLFARARLAYRSNSRRSSKARRFTGYKAWYGTVPVVAANADVPMFRTVTVDPVPSAPNPSQEIDEIFETLRPSKRSRQPSSSSSSSSSGPLRIGYIS